MSAEEYVFHAKVDYMRILGEWGPKCRTHLHKTPIESYLHLPAQSIKELMHPMLGFNGKTSLRTGSWSRTNHLIESALYLIEEARQNRNGWRLRPKEIPMLKDTLKSFKASNNCVIITGNVCETHREL